MPDHLNTAVLFLVYARPRSTDLVFRQIRKARPKRLYIAADGPKPGIPATSEKCARVREIVKGVDWDCEVKTLFRDENLGCKVAVSQAISWFFSHEEEGIILEDDCLPHLSFFYFCQNLLEKYRDDQRVMHIGGTNLQFGRQHGNASYYFSSIAMIWGWAAWRRSWNLYDIDMPLFPEFKKSGMLENILPDKEYTTRLMEVLQLNYDGKIVTWDHQYGFSIAINNGLCIFPNVNLISNLGFAKDDDLSAPDPYMLSQMPTSQIADPLVHPQFFIPDKKADLFHVLWDVSDTKELGRKRLEKFQIPYYE